MPTPSAALLGVPVWLGLLAALVLVIVPGMVICMGWVITRRATSTDLPQALLGLSHVISAVCGPLPWRKPSTQPPPPEPVVPEPVALPQALVVVRNDVALPRDSDGQR